MDKYPQNRTLVERVARLEREVERLAAKLKEMAPEEAAELSVPEEVALSEPEAVVYAEPPPLPVRFGGEAVFQEEPEVVRGEEVEEEWEEVEPGRDWRAALRQWHLWPPEADGSVEVQVGAWWATRLGALIAVIGVVFFGIYVAQGTPPWVRLAQVAAIAAATVAGGHWLERRVPRFGAVVFGGGLALAFFAGFAAYTVPAVKTIDSLFVAIAVQAVLVAGIIGCSLWKDRATLATMAVFLGFVTCVFSFFSNLPNFGLAASGMLAVAGVLLWLRRGWLAVFGVSLPGTYLVYAMTAGGWISTGAPPLAWALAHPVGAFLLFTAGDYGGLLRGRKLTLGQRRSLQGGNAAGAVSLSVWMAKTYFPESMPAVYFLFGGLAGAAAFLYYRRDAADELASVGFAMAMGLFALGIIDLLGTRTRWVALAVQSAVALYAAKKTKLRLAEATGFALWAGSILLFFVDTAEAGLLQTRGAAWSFWGGAAALYLVIGVWLLSWHGRWTKRGSEISLASGIALGVVATVVAYGGSSSGFFPMTAVLVAVGIAGLGRWMRHWVGLVGAAVPFLAAQTGYLAMGGNPGDGWRFWANSGLAVGSGMAVGWWMQRALGSGRFRMEEGPMRLAIGLGHGVWMVALQAFLARTVSLEAGFAAGAGLALGMLLLAGKRRISYVADLALFFVVLAAGAAVLAMGKAEYLPESGNEWLLWVGVFGCFAVVCVRDCWAALEERERLFSGPVDVVAAGIVATLYGFYALEREFDPPFLVGLTGLAAVAVLLLARWPGWRGGVFAGLFYVIVGHVVALLDPEAAIRMGDLWTGLAAMVVLAGCAVTFVLLVARPEFSVSERLVARLQWGVSAAALGTVFAVIAFRAEPVSSYVTVSWGMAAIGFFVAGLGWRVRPLRLTGLVGLGLCLPRIFVVDIHSTFYRIAAFVVVGLVLLLVGFLYHKYRHRI